jgi:hypothetical protein
MLNTLRIWYGKKNESIEVNNQMRKFNVDLHMFVVDEREESTRKIQLCVYPRFIAMQRWEPRRKRFQIHATKTMI